jgi:hypothetical protein
VTPCCCQFEGISIHLYYEDHNLSHFRAVFAGKELKIDIHTLEIIEGKLPPAKERLVLQWARKRQAELLENWERRNKRLPLRKIEP